MPVYLRFMFLLAFSFFVVFNGTGAASASGSNDSVTFDDIATDPSFGLDYQRTESPTELIFDQIKTQPLYTFNDVLQTPIKTRGVPGVALFDVEQDGDLDIYVTNGPGSSNSLFLNQLADSGVLTFWDAGSAAGVDATSQDSTGVCYGDLDNDGFQDLYVLGNNEPNRLFWNQGDGTFVDVSTASGADAGARSRATCAFGDIDNDGLLDILVGNSFSDWSNQLGLFVEPYALNQHNQLFRNLGNMIFAEVTASSGLLNQVATVPEGFGEAGLTWSIALADMDVDGDVDVIAGDDQGGIPFAVYGGVDRGLIHIFDNDGSGFFTDTTLSAGTDKPGQWMGLAFGDLDCNGTMDLFGSNFGDYGFSPLPIPYTLGDSASRWFLGNGDGTYSDPGVGDLVATPFGWSNAIVDYDLDGDSDIVFHGGLDVSPFVDLSNAGVFLRNEGCSADFAYDAAAVAGSTDHGRRNVQAMAMGDLNNDGFPDVVSASNFDAPPPIPLTTHAYQYGGPFDADAVYVEAFIPTGNPFEWTWSGIEFPDGSLAVELNSADNGNRGIRIDLEGGAGRISGAVSNRDGIGAVIKTTPHGGPTSMVPVGASSYTSQGSLEVAMGLGRSFFGTVEVVWPGGVHNRVYNVWRGRTLHLPEIPCDFTAEWSSFGEYRGCVRDSLQEWRSLGTISKLEKAKLYLSALRAYFETHY